MDAIYYDESEYGETPRCPFSRRHHLSAEPGGYYCYECAEHYGNPPSLTGPTRRGKMDHATAVRVAKSGQGAIVAELLRLSHEIQEASERIARLTEMVEELQAFRG